MTEWELAVLLAVATGAAIIVGPDMLRRGLEAIANRWGRRAKIEAHLGDVVQPTVPKARRRAPLPTPPPPRRRKSL